MYEIQALTRLKINYGKVCLHISILQFSCILAIEAQGIMFGLERDSELLLLLQINVPMKKLSINHHPVAIAGEIEFKGKIKTCVFFNMSVF